MALSFHVSDARPMVAVPVLEATKLALHQRMVDAGISNVDPAREIHEG
jgi:hypothetical protein